MVSEQTPAVNQNSWHTIYEPAFLQEVSQEIRAVFDRAAVATPDWGYDDIADLVIPEAPAHIEAIQELARTDMAALAVATDILFHYGARSPSAHSRVVPYVTAGACWKVAMLADMAVLRELKINSPLCPIPGRGDVSLNLERGGIYILVDHDGYFSWFKACPISRQAYQNAVIALSDPVEAGIEKACQIAALSLNDAYAPRHLRWASQSWTLPDFETLNP